MTTIHDPKLKAFLDLIAWSEGVRQGQHPLTQNDGYDVIVTGINGPSIFTDYSRHPFEIHGAVQWRLNPPGFSTAAGRYQVLARFWRIYKAQLGLTDFSPLSQDLVALTQMKERGVTAETLTERSVVDAIVACSNIWASFPGNVYGQPSRDMTTLAAKYGTLLMA